MLKLRKYFVKELTSFIALCFEDLSASEKKKLRDEAIRQFELAVNGAPGQSKCVECLAIDPSCRRLGDSHFIYGIQSHPDGPVYRVVASRARDYEKVDESQKTTSLQKKWRI